MELKKTSLDYGYDANYILDDKQIYLRILIGEDGNLYWGFDDISKDGKDVSEITLRITKKDSELYSIFKDLYDSLIASNVYHLDSLDVSMCSNFEEVVLKETAVSIKNKKLMNENAYGLLIHDGVVTWHSDGDNYEEANVLRINEDDEGINVTLVVGSKEYGQPGTKFIRFRDSDSNYDPYNLVFLNHLYHLKKYYDSKAHKKEETNKDVKRLTFKPIDVNRGIKK